MLSPRPLHSRTGYGESSMQALLLAWAFFTSIDHADHICKARGATRTADRVFRDLLSGRMNFR